MRARVIVRLKRIRDDVVRRKAIVKFDGFLINGLKSRGKALARRHVSQTISTAYMKFISHNYIAFPTNLKIYPEYFDTEHRLTCCHTFDSVFPRI